MSYAQFAQKIEILRHKFEIIKPGKIADALDNDKTTAWRWLTKPQSLDDKQQRQLVEAICSVLKTSGHELEEDAFLINNIVDFCSEIDVSPLQAAIITKMALPVHDIFFESAFQSFTGDERRNLRGSYLLFRHDKERTHKTTPYLQAYARIYSDNEGRLAYMDSWAGDGEEYAQTFEGFVIKVGAITNVIGQRKRTDPEEATELFWQGLRRMARKDKKISCLYGYVSDVTTNDRSLFTDRMLLIRALDSDVDQVRKKQDYYVTAKHVENAAGSEMFHFLEEWSGVPIKEPGKKKRSS
ncbi:MAG: hypothetical protein KGJ49_04900 [Alphaproteobacteria bacterium]|nr:hypothetical protein [Alphaproteobacteria bacterium]